MMRPLRLSVANLNAVVTTITDGRAQAHVIPTSTSAEVRIGVANMDHNEMDQLTTWLLAVRPTGVSIHVEQW